MERAPISTALPVGGDPSELGKVVQSAVYVTYEMAADEGMLERIADEVRRHWLDAARKAFD